MKAPSKWIKIAAFTTLFGAAAFSGSDAVAETPPDQSLNVVDKPSVNFDERRNGRTIKYIVLHHTATRTFKEAFNTLTKDQKGPDVSAHYLVDIDGTIVRLVDEQKRAWHAGTSFWRGLDDLNSSSIGIEIQNTGDQPFAEAQVQAVTKLCQDIMRRHNIPPQNVVAHGDVAPDRKEDPSVHFPWQRLSEDGVGIWPRPVEKIPPVWKARLLLQKCGYDRRINLMTCLTAFQRRFEPGALSNAWKYGVPSPSTLQRLQSVADQTAKPWNRHKKRMGGAEILPPLMK